MSLHTVSQSKSVLGNDIVVVNLQYLKIRAELPSVDLDRRQLVEGQRSVNKSTCSSVSARLGDGHASTSEHGFR